MPKKIVLLLILGLLWIAMSTTIALQHEKLSNLLSPLFSAFLLVGLLTGNEDTRGILKVFGWISVSLSIIGVLMLLFLMRVGLKAGVAQYVTLLSIFTFGLAQNLYFLWCLGHKDVIDWMLRRSPKQA